jgi:hypothetical protein
LFNLKSWFEGDKFSKRGFSQVKQDVGEISRISIAYRRHSAGTSPAFSVQETVSGYEHVEELPDFFIGWSLDLSGLPNAFLCCFS